jgi:hypothetical protein
MHVKGSHRSRSVVAWLLGVGLLATLAVGCDSPRSSARPSASLLEIDVSFAPSPSADSSVEPTPQQTFVSIPVGWDNSFCGVLADAVIAQELVIDIERALNEEAVRDARGLARELTDITADATGILAQMPAWDTGADATAKLAALIDLDTKAAEQYGLAFQEQSDNALRRARGFRRDVGRQTPDVNAALAALSQQGISCDPTPMQLETF